MYNSVHHLLEIFIKSHKRRTQNGGWGSHILSALARPPPLVTEPNLPHTPSLILRMASQQLQLAQPQCELP